jgi:protein gp37
MGETSISWTNWTWNPLRGCLEISPGCAFCYAAAYAARFSGLGQPYEGLAYFDANGKAHWTGLIRTVPEKLVEPIRKRKPLMIFVNSMSDLFHEDVPDEFIAAVFAVMGIARHHTYQVLTKRAGRMANLVSSLTWDDCVNAFCRQYPRSIDIGFSKPAWPLPNVWLGVSTEDQKRADERIPHLLRTPAAVRFLSVEPLLGLVSLTSKGYIAATGDHPEMYGYMAGPDDGKSVVYKTRGEALANSGISWVIVGGESGPKARPCDLAWIRSVVGQCREAGVPAFVKQMGSNPKGNCTDCTLVASERLHCLQCDRFRDPKGGDPSEWPADLRIQEFPGVSQAVGVQGNLF